MSKVCAFFADGLEEVEALTVVDLLRRAEVEVTTVSIGQQTEVLGSHGIRLHADTTLDQVDDFMKFEMVFLPGGGLGTENLEKNQQVRDVIGSFFAAGKRIAAICAAPGILGAMGLLKGRKATSYPSVTGRLEGAEVTENPAQTDGNITTSRGVGTAIDMGLELIKILCGEEKTIEIGRKIVYLP